MQLTDGKTAKRWAIKFSGQGKNTTTYNLARMNLMMHSVSFNTMTLSNADTIEIDWHDGSDAKVIDHPYSFNAVVANPPYSAHWDDRETKLKDPRFKDYGKPAPKTKDILFIDASKEFEKDKNQNKLTDKNINKIIETY